MKRIFCTLLIALFTLSLIGQEHLVFKGIPIDGPVKDFGAALIAKGCKYDHTEDYIHIYKGTLANRSCEIDVLECKKGNFVYSVFVTFDPVDYWSGLKSEYNELKKTFIAKYGEPKDDYHFFDSPYYDGDGYEMSALRNKKVHFMSNWKVEGGSIFMLILNAGYGKGQVTVTYDDEINKEKNKNLSTAAAIDDL